MSEQEILVELKETIEKIKRGVAVKEGERNSLLEQIKKDFGVKNLNEAYEKLKVLGTDIEIKKERREELLKEAQEKLKSYRR
jgi:inorganic pyrophosphatase/exopolyphosphatase